MRTVSEYFKFYLDYLGAETGRWCCESIVRSSAPRYRKVASCMAQQRSASCLIEPIHNTGIRVANGGFRSSRPESMCVKAVSLNFPSVGTFFSATASRCFQRNPRMLHTKLCCGPPSAGGKCNIGCSACGCMVSRYPTASRHRVTPFYPSQTPTNFSLWYPTPYLRSATYQLCSRRSVSSHVRSVFRVIILTLPGP